MSDDNPLPEPRLNRPAKPGHGETWDRRNAARAGARASPWRNFVINPNKPQHPHRYRKPPGDPKG